MRVQVVAAACQLLCTAPRLNPKLLAPAPLHQAARLVASLEVALGPLPGQGPVSSPLVKDLSKQQAVFNASRWVCHFDMAGFRA